MSNPTSGAVVHAGASEHPAVTALNIEFEAFCRTEYQRWTTAAPLNLPVVGGWNGNIWFNRIEQRNRRWADHITPLAIAWWAERGYRAEFHGPA